MTQDSNAGKPQAPPLPTRDQVPASLLTRCWRASYVTWNPEKSRWDKNKYGLDAWNDPATWVTFDDAFAGANGRFNTVSYVLSGDGICAADIDGCIQDGALDPVVKQWVDNFFSDSYIERTTSGTGLRIIFKTNTPFCQITEPKQFPRARDGVTIEFFTKNKILIFTGNRYGTATDIVDATFAWDKLRGQLHVADYEPPGPVDSRLKDKLARMERALIEAKIAHGLEVEHDNYWAWQVECPFCSKREACVVVRKDGGLGFKCQHKSTCSERHWQDFKKRTGIIVSEPTLAEFQAAELQKVDAWLYDTRIAPPSLDSVLISLSMIDPIQIDVRRKQLAARLGVSVPGLKKSIKKQQEANEHKQESADFDAASASIDDVKQAVETLIDVKPQEWQKKKAEGIIWDYIHSHAQVFCCGGLGYLLMNGGDGVPIAVSRDGQDFNRLLISFGVHPGSPMRDRIGQFVGTKCYHEGIQTETRLAFHFEPRTFTVYAAARRGVLLKITKWGFDEVPNGTDGQLFIFPDNWKPLFTKPLDVSGAPLDGFPKSDMCRRALFADGFLVKNLFGGANFEIRAMDDKQIRLLILAYVLFLMMPGVVSERVMLQTLGPSGSGKTFLLVLIGRLLLGSTFSVRPMPEDIREFENQIINEYLIAYDNVSKIPASIRDRFCQSVTGVEVVRRELFTTAQEARYKSKATISLSAINPPLPELEHQNRTLSINFNERDGGYIASEELLKVVDCNRDDLTLNLIRRVVLALEALEAQREYAPKVNVRLASVATFILRIAKHEGWEERAQKLLDAWSAEQVGYSMQDDDISTALTLWIGEKDWQKTFEPSKDNPNGVEFTATMLEGHLRRVMKRKGAELNWKGSHLVLAKIISRNLKVYTSRFGLQRRTSARTSNHTYSFNPSAELLLEIKKDAEYMRQNTPREDSDPHIG